MNPHLISPLKHINKVVKSLPKTCQMTRKCPTKSLQKLVRLTSKTSQIDKLLTTLKTCQTLCVGAIPFKNKGGGSGKKFNYGVHAMGFDISSLLQCAILPPSKFRIPIVPPVYNTSKRDSFLAESNFTASIL